MGALVRDLRFSGSGTLSMRASDESQRGATEWLLEPELVDTLSLCEV
jgi:hypothetical protein